MITIGGNLECSSRGDKRFSAFYAKVTIFGKTDSIENHYQLSKRFNNIKPSTWRDAKGKKPTHFTVNGVSYNVNKLSEWYKLLWFCYLEQNPELVTYASQFDTFSDMFKGKSTNCQADIVRQYIQNGSDSVFEDCRELLELMGVIS